ncbi:MAG: hypothetical protein ABJB74_05265 [Gemmatimonas sp.]
MRAYITVTGILFALLVVVHIWRAVDEGVHIAQDPAVVVSTLVGLAMSAWAASLLRKPRE